MRQLKIGTSWVRGVVGDSLTPELIVNLGCAFGTYCDGGTVVVGRDTRQSSDMLRAAAVASLLSAGCRVVDLGFSPTPLVSFAIRHMGAAGGLSITGGHNDSRWNALKFIGADGALLNAISSEEVLDIYHASEFTRVPWDGLKEWVRAPDILGHYLDHITAALDVERIRSAKLRVAVDFCNGTGAAVAAPLLEALGCEMIPLNEEPEAEFAHPPAPSVENMRQLAALLRYLNADLGVALNIDGDRIGLVTADGTPLSEEDSFPLVADYLLSRSPGPVVTNLSTSHMIDEVARRYGQPVIRTYIGEGYVVDKGLTAHAVIAGEGSGGIAILPTVSTFDGFLALGLVLEAMAAHGETLSALAARLPRYVMKKGSLSCPPDRVHAVMEHFRAVYPDQETDQTDGLLVRWEDAWLHVRGSNTEPMVRIIAEAKDAARVESLFEEAMTRAHRVVYGNVERPQ